MIDDRTDAIDDHPNRRRQLSAMQDLSPELFDSAVALARKKYPDQPPGFPFSEDLDLNKIRLPPELEKQIREEVEDDGSNALVDDEEETGFESVIGEPPTNHAVLHSAF